MLINYDKCSIYNVDGLTFIIDLQTCKCVNHSCPFCGQNTLNFLGVHEFLTTNPPQYKIDIACDNPRCPGHHNLSGIIIEGEYNTDKQSAMTNTIKKLLDRQCAFDKIVSSKDSMVKEQEVTSSQSETTKTPIMDIVKIPENNYRPVLYTECWCNSPYHSIRWYIDDIDECYRPALTFECYLNPTISFWQRVKNAWNYIFNSRYVNGGFDFFEISKEDLPKLKSLIEQVEQKNNETHKENNVQ
jgi:hypothetical protein